MLGLAGPALHGLLGIDATRRDGALLLVPLAGLPAYSALALAGLVLLVMLAIAWAAGRWARAGRRAAPAWDSGFAAPPAWLPFGDPATELGPAGFSGELQRIFRPVLPGAGPAWPALRTIGDRIAAAMRRLPGAEGVEVPLALAVLAAMLLAIWLAGA